LKTEPLTRQVHIRVPQDLKKALKMFCAREGVTEQSWLLEMIDSELARRAGDLWPAQGSPGADSRSAARKPDTGTNLTQTQKGPKTK
jgi:hypothetical protein